MGRKTKEHIIADDDKIGIQFLTNGANYRTVKEYAETVVNPETKKPYTMSGFLGGLVARVADDIRAGKKIKI